MWAGGSGFTGLCPPLKATKPFKWPLRERERRKIGSNEENGQIIQGDEHNENIIKLGESKWRQTKTLRSKV